MDRRTFLLCAVAAAALSPLSALAANVVPTPPQSPEAIVKVLYAVGNTTDVLTQKGPRAKTFTPAMAKLIARTIAKSQKRDEPAIDYEPLIDGQDGEVKDLVVAATASDAAEATVEARFVSFGEKFTVTFDFMLVAGIWKLDDIRGREGTGLKKICQDYMK